MTLMEFVDLYGLRIHDIFQQMVSGYVGDNQLISESDEFGFAVLLGPSGIDQLKAEIAISLKKAGGETERLANVVIRLETEEKTLFFLVPDNFTESVWIRLSDGEGWERKFKILEDGVASARKEIEAWVLYFPQATIV